MCGAQWRVYRMLCWPGRFAAWDYLESGETTHEQGMSCAAPTQKFTEA
jgi:hypothetical protein